MPVLRFTKYLCTQYGDGVGGGEGGVRVALMIVWEYVKGIIGKEAIFARIGNEAYCDDDCVGGG